VTLRRVIMSTGSAVANFMPRLRPALSIRSVLSGRFARTNVGLRLSTTGSFVSRVTPGIRLTQLVSGTVRPAVRPALRLSTIGTLAKPTARPALRITQDRVILAGPYGANTATKETYAGRSDWANEANATAKKNATFATLTGDALAARAGALRLKYADFVSKSSMTITDVKIDIYAKMTGATLANATVIFEYSWDNGASWTAVPGIGGTNTVGNFDTTAAGFAASIFANVNTWARLDAFEARCLVSLDLAESYVVSVDAIHLVVNAERIVNV
jgi:hypothetical protein